MHPQNGLKWPHFLILALVFILGIVVPLSWHRQRGRHPIEPLSGRNQLYRQPAVDPSTDEQHSFWRFESVAHGKSDLKPNNSGSLYRRWSPIADPAPRYTASAWPAAHTLLIRLHRLAQTEVARVWAQNATDQLSALQHCTSLTSEQAPEIFSALQKLIDGAIELAPGVDDRDTLYELNAARYDLIRRLDVWKASYQLTTHFPQGVLPSGQPFLTASLVSGGDDTPNADFCTVKLSNLLAAIEQYEFSRRGSDGTQLASAIDPLLKSANESQRSLGTVIDQHYRNANLRIVATDNLMNRFLPPTRNDAGKIDDTILGIPVWGNSRTRTSLRTRLIPDPHQIRIGMEAWGRVFSDTVASNRSVYLYNEGETAFLVRKLILIDHHGVKAKPTIAHAISETELIDIETDYDNIPFVGSWVRKAARKKHAEGHDQALNETESRVATQARRTFDQQLDPRLRKGIDGFYYELWKPLDRLGLEPTAVQLYTTEKRATGRLRLGHSQQLAGCSARPRALSNSLLSMQFHESAINNGFAQLDLDGKSFSLHDLYLHVMEKMGRDPEEVPESMTKKVHVTFASQDPFSVRCEDDRVTLVMSLKKITKGSKYKWSNLRITADYGIESEGNRAYLVRQNAIRLEGKKLRTRDQIALRGVFSKVLSRGNEIPLVPKKVTENPRMEDVVITQKQIRDGWIGIALGPRGPQTANLQHRPETRNR